MPSTSPDHAADPTWTRLTLAAIVLGALCVSVCILGQTQWIDDSFISFRYARHLFEGHGLVFNPGDPVEGYTNFLWCIVAWLGLKLNIEPIAFTQGVSLVAQALTLVLVYRLGRASLGSAAKALVAPALLALQIAFVAYPMTGMESTAFSFFATLSFYLLHQKAQDRAGGRVLLVFSLLALSLTRFDGFILAGILAGFPLFVKRGWRGLLVPLVAVAVGLVAYNAWRLSTYPTALPNSFHAKIHFSPFRIRKGLSYVWEFFENRALLLALCMMPLALSRVSNLGRYLIWAVGIQLAYVGFVGGDWMPNHRFLYHVLPLVILLAQEGTWNLWGHLEPRLTSKRRASTLLMAILLGSAALTLYEDVRAGILPDKQFFDHHEAKVIGEALNDLLPEGSVIALEWGGIIPYYTRHEVLDTFGITDREISGGDFPSSIWGRQVSPEYVASRGPDLVAPCARIFPTEKAALRSTRGKAPCNYRYYMRMNNPSMGYVLKILRLGEGQYWPAIVKADGPLAK
ncbi:MAG: hypothetical protein CMJ98_02295 [Planctomycetes bacterium]|nr:hypothetical protein [Planctomycetota bacterium]